MPADKLLAGIERLMSPKLSEIIGELKAINARIDSTNERITSLQSKMDTKFEAEDVKIDKSLNEKLWSKSAQKPPTILRLKIVKVDDKTVKAELLEK